MAKQQIKKQTLIDNAIKALDTLAEAYPKAVLAIETPSGYISVSLSSAIIYEGMSKEPLIVVDAE